jgi:uncharacterized membrane protein YdbT with pleckstrin-like domain
MSNLERQALREKLVEMLRANPILAELNDFQIEQLVDRADIEVVKVGEIIIRQGDLANTFYFIIDGQVRVIDTSRRPAKLWAYLQQGDFLGERALLFNEPRSATVDVVVDTQLAVFDRATWNWLIGSFPSLREKFTNLEEQRYEQRSQLEFPGRQLNEVVVRQDKRHILAFVAKLPGPLILIVSGLAIAILLIDLDFLSLGLVNLFTIFIVVVGMLWIIYDYIDWINDDFIVTSDRVIHIERNIIYGQRREEAPLTQIQDVSTTIPNLFTRFFDYSDLLIRTAGAGIILFDGLPQADKTKAVIFEQRALAQQRVEASDTSAIRKSLVERMGWDVGPVEPSTLVATGPAPAKRQVKLPRLVNYFIPRTREEKDDTITWHKHYFVLLKLVALPLFAGFIFFYLTLDALFGLYFFPLPTTSVVLPLVILWLLMLVWYSYQYDAWSKDIYIVTPTTIIDVEGTPFSLAGERRRQGTFDVIQNTTVDIPSLFAQLLNMGDVVIETAGTADTFTFEQVYNPKEVQQEIFKRWVNFKENERRRARTAEEKRYTRWLGEYHDLARQAAQRSREG